METKTRSKKSKYIKKSSMLAITVIVVQLISLITRIPLTNIIGDEGNAFYAAAYEIYLLLLLLTSYSIPASISKLISARMAKGQLKNANRIFRMALLYAIAISAVVGAATFFFADFLAGTLMLEPMAATSLRFFAPILLIMAVSGVLCGYFQGIGTTMPTAISQITGQIITSVTAIVGAVAFANYGTKVGTLLYNDSFKAAYGALGIVCAVGIGAMIGLLFLLFVFQVYHKNFKHQMSKDTIKTRETYGQISKVFMVSMLPLFIGNIICNSNALIDQLIFNRIMVAKGFEAVKSAQFGVYIGKYKILTGILFMLGSFFCVSVAPMIRSAIGKVDGKVIRERIASTIHMAMVLVIPLAVALAVLAEPILKMLFTEDSALAVTLLQMGSVTIVLFTLDMFSGAILQGFQKTQRTVVHTAIALAVRIVSAILMMQQLDLGINALLFADILFAVILYGLNQTVIHKSLKLKQELVKTFFMPIGASAIMGVIIFMIQKALESPLGNSAATLLSILLGGMVYLLLLVMFRGLSEKELLAMPGGRVIAKITKGMRK